MEKSESGYSFIVDEEDVMGTLQVNAFGIMHAIKFGSKTTARNIVRLVSKKMGIVDYKYFGLKRFRNNKKSKDKKHQPKLWLSDSREVCTQGCNSATVLFLMHKYWPIDAKYIKDPNALQFLYQETKQKIITGVYPCAEDDLAQLAAFSLIIENKFDQLHKMDLIELFPSNIIPTKSHDAWMKHVCIFKDQSEGDIVETQQKYLNYARTHVSLITNQFFPAEYATREMAKTIPMLIGISPFGIGVYESHEGSNPTLQIFHKYSDLEKCALTPSAGTQGRSAMNSVRPAGEKFEKASLGITCLPAIQDDIERGPAKFLFTISTTKKNMKDIRFQISSFLANDTNLVDFINYYQAEFDSHVEKISRNSVQDVILTMYLSDGTLGKKIRVDGSTTGQELAIQFCNKVGIDDASFFQVAVYEDGLYRWLSLVDPVLIQGIQENSFLVLKIRFFFKDLNEIEDSMALYMYYLQVHAQFKRGESRTSERVIVQLMAYFLKIVYPNNDVSKKESLIHTIDSNLPGWAHHFQPKLTKKILKEYSLLATYIKETAVEKYLKISNDEIPTFGYTFFNIVIPRITENAYLGVCKQGCAIFNNEMEPVSFYRFGYELRSWINSGETIKMTVKPSRHAIQKTVKFVCLKFEEVFGLLNGYSQMRKLDQVN